MRGIVFSSRNAEWPALREALEASGQFSSLSLLDAGSPAEEIHREIQRRTPHLVIIDRSSFERLAEVRDIAAHVNPHIHLAAAGDNLHGDELLSLMRNGVREYLPAPFGPEELDGPLSRLQQRIDANPGAFPFSEDLFVFLPAQAGVGATTLAVQVALALAEDRKRKALLVDLDLSNGLIAFLLRLTNPIPVSDALSRDVELDEEMLARLVASRGGLDVTRSGEMQFDGRLDPSRVMELLTAARRKYETVCVDVSEAMNEHEVAAMQEAREIFLVCTPQVPVLYMARRRILELSRLGLAGRVRVIVNRAGTNSMVQPAQVAELLGVQEYLPVANDYARVSQAWVSGERIPPKTELGRDIRALAAWMARADIAAEQSKEQKPKTQLGWMESLRSRFLKEKGPTEAQVAETNADGLAALSAHTGVSAGPPADEAAGTKALARGGAGTRLVRRKRGEGAKSRVTDVSSTT
ncbi:MAG: hypothetical protein IT163_10630 [Bryobacterales bacterium]|nr:hypothetical protein [Bryobacterales bacterium]